MNWDLRTVDEILLELELDDYKDFLVDGLIAADVTTILGDPFVGKTYLAIDIARSLTTGKPLLGRQVAKTVDRVAFLCTDPGGCIKIARRVAAAGLDKTRVVAQQFYPPQTWQEWQEAVAVFKSNHIDAIIVDNTTDLADDANNPRDVKVITDGLRLWSDNGTTILNVHHLNKGHAGQNRGMFGSSMWRKWTRVELLLTKSYGRHHLETTANDAESVRLDLTFAPSGTPAFTVDGSRPQTVRRSKPVLDENARLKPWLDAHQGLPERTAARQATKDLGFTVSRSRVNRVKGMDFGEQK